MSRILALTAALVFTSLPSDVLAQTTITINNNPNYSANKRTSCDFTSGFGSSSTQPLYGESGGGNRNGIEFVLYCLGRTPLDASLAQAVNIHVICDEPGAATCEYLASSSGQTYNMGLNGQTAERRLVGFPTQKVVIKTSSEIYVRGSNWRVEGITFDGQRDSPGGNRSGGGTFIRLTGSDITFTKNRVGNTSMSCLKAGDDDPATPPASRINITNNKIISCHQKPFTLNRDLWQDSHCVYTHDAQDLTVAYNEMAQCSGDAFQTLNETDSLGAWRFPQAPQNTKIVGNIMHADQVTDVEGGIEYCRTVGENAIDIKRTGKGLLIQDNKMWGYRPSHQEAPGQAGILDCGGTNDRNYVDGAAFVFQGPVTNPDGTLCNDVGCAVIEGNDISASQRGLVVGVAAAFPDAPRGLIIRGNTIHDLRAFDGLDATLNPIRAKDKGVGMDLRFPNDKNRLGAPNRVYRNTFANIPGESMRVTAWDGSPTSTDYNSRNFDVRNNLVAWTGGVQPAPGLSSTCSGPKHVSEVTVAPNFGPNVGLVSNYAYYALSASQSTTQSVAVTTSAGPSFIKPLGAENAPGDAFHPQVTQASCGANLPALPAGFHGGNSYDYRLKVASVKSGAEDSTEVDTTPGFTERHSDFTGSQAFCGSAPDIGANEACATSLIHMVEQLEYTDEMEESNQPLMVRDTPEGHSEGSDDLGWAPKGMAIQRPNNCPMYPNRATCWPVHRSNKWSNTDEYDFYVRIRNKYNYRFSPNANAPIRIRVFTSDLPSPSWPADFTLVKEQTVYWNCGQNCPSDYSLIPHAWGVYTTDNIFKFPVKIPVLVKRSGSPLTARVEISSPLDPRPPLHYDTKLSNNLAQLMILMEP